MKPDLCLLVTITTTKAVVVNYVFNERQMLIQYWFDVGSAFLVVLSRGHILVQVTIYRRLLIGRDGHLDPSEAYDIS